MMFGIMKLLFVYPCTGFGGRVWGTRGLEGVRDEATRVGHKDSDSQILTGSAASQAQPISNSRSTCGITQVRKAGKNCAAATAAQGEGENMQEEQL